jgi:hypothetical protein
VSFAPFFDFEGAGAAPSLLSLKFVEEQAKATADPSTSFGSRKGPNSAQDDSAVVVRTLDSARRG